MEASRERERYCGPSQAQQAQPPTPAVPCVLAQPGMPARVGSVTLHDHGFGSRGRLVMCMMRPMMRSSNTATPSVPGSDSGKVRCQEMLGSVIAMPAQTSRPEVWLPWFRGTATAPGVRLGTAAAIPGSSQERPDLGGRELVIASEVLGAVFPIPDGGMR